MPLEDLSDPTRFLRKMKKDVKRAPVRSAPGDTGHAGAGSHSILLGTGAEANGYESIQIGHNGVVGADAGTGVGAGTAVTGYGGTALGETAHATADQATGVGQGARGEHARSTALGADSETTAADQIMLGTASQTVVAPGVFSNPSARRLKKKICTAPKLTSIFPDLYEWQYKKDATGRRQISPIADHLIGTDAERFLTFDAKGRVSGIDNIGLHTVQIAALHADLLAERAEKRELIGRLERLEALVEKLAEGR